MKKPTNIFSQDCLEIFFLFFTSLKPHRNSKNDQFTVKTSKTFLLLLIERFLVPILNLTLKCKIGLFEIYQTLVRGIVSWGRNQMFAFSHDMIPFQNLTQNPKIVGTISQKQI